MITKMNDICKYTLQQRLWGVFLLLILLCANSYAQNIQQTINHAKILVDDGKYQEAYKCFQSITESQVNEYGDSCLMLYNYGKGACLYFMDKYEEAIPFLQKGLKYMEGLPHENCNYLEMMYGIGACYKKLGNYNKAEEYFRRTILKGNYFNLNCAIRNQTYGEMAELYSLMGKPEFADICTSRIESEMKLHGSKNLDIQVDDLYDLFEAYEKQGKIEESINTLKKILHLIDDNKGKVNEDYLLYSNLLGLRLRYYYNRPKEAAPIHKEMIEIGKNFKTCREDICNAYEDYLRYLAENGKTDSIKQILPSALKYYTSTKDRSRPEDNLYEIIGIGLFDAGQYDEAISYLEKEWKGKKANSIKALNGLGLYYTKSDPEKALAYYKKAESQFNNETNDYTRSVIYEDIMWLYKKMGNNLEAIKYGEKAEPYMSKLGDNAHFLNHLVNLAVICVDANEFSKANEIVIKAKPFIEQVPVDTKLSTYSNLGYIFIKSNKPDEAVEVLLVGVDMAVNENKERTSVSGMLYHNLGKAYMLKADYKKALAALYKSRDIQKEVDKTVSSKTTDYIKECESK